MTEPESKAMERLRELVTRWGHATHDMEEVTEACAALAEEMADAKFEDGKAWSPEYECAETLYDFAARLREALK